MIVCWCRGGRLRVHPHAGGLGADHGVGVLVVAQYAVRVQARRRLLDTVD